MWFMLTSKVTTTFPTVPPVLVKGICTEVYVVDVSSSTAKCGTAKLIKPLTAPVAAPGRGKWLHKAANTAGREQQ